ncbi:MAG: hypothetical protein MUC65_09380 [Pontiellaceae bacterium]|nr:hypothetical protein [Pontiellaceae bacterium]
MAAGDAQKAWYPEMLLEIKEQWSRGTSWDDVIRLCERMTILRKELAVAKSIKPPMIKCPKCGTRERSGYPKISVRSLFFALQKINVITDDEFKQIERDWKKHQRENSLDAYGRKKS